MVLTAATKAGMGLRLYYTKASNASMANINVTYCDMSLLFPIP